MRSTDRRSRLERFLGLFAEVRAGEAGAVLLLTADVFLLLTAYYVIKPVREALIITGGGAEIASYAAAGQALLLLVIVPAYARLAGRLPRRRLITVVTLIFAGCLVAFYLLARTGVPLAVPFFLWVGIFNMMIVAQFWAFANDLYTTEEGTRLFAIVAFGASSGAVVGSEVTDRLVATLGVYQLLLLSAALLVASLALTNVAARRRRREREDADAAAARRRSEAAEQQLTPPPDAGTTAPDEGPLGEGGAFALVWRNRYLLLIALLLLLTNWINTTGEYLLRRVVSDAAASAAEGEQVKVFIANFYARFYKYVNIASLVVQLFLVSRAIKYLGVRISLLVLPLIALGGYLALAFVPVLAVVRWAKTAENATDYSLQNTVRNVLFLPTTREEKYKAKQAIDAFFVRAGDVLSAGLVFVGAEWFAWSIGQFALVNVGLVVVWIGVALATGNRYRTLAAQSEAVDRSS